MYTYATAVKEYYWQEALFCLWNKVALTKNYMIKLAKSGLTKQTTIQANEILIHSSDISEHFIMQNDN